MDESPDHPPVLLRYRGKYLDYDWLWMHRHINTGYWRTTLDTFYNVNSYYYDITIKKLSNENLHELKVITYLMTRPFKKFKLKKILIKKYPLLDINIINIIVNLVYPFVLPFKFITFNP